MGSLFGGGNVKHKSGIKHQRSFFKSLSALPEGRCWQISATHKPQQFIKWNINPSAVSFIIDVLNPGRLIWLARLQRSSPFFYEHFDLTEHSKVGKGKKLSAGTMNVYIIWQQAVCAYHGMCHCVSVHELEETPQKDSQKKSQGHITACYKEFTWGFEKKSYNINKKFQIVGYVQPARLLVGGHSSNYWADKYGLCLETFFSPFLFYYVSGAKRDFSVNGAAW